MLKWAAIFFVIAIVAAALGFGGVAGTAMGIAKFLFWVFIAVAILFVILALFTGRKLTGH